MADRIRTMDEVLADLKEVAANFDGGWRAEPPTMAALVRRVIRDVGMAWATRAPTPWAYDQACAALDHWRAEAKRLAALAGVEPRSMQQSIKQD